MSLPMEDVNNEDNNGKKRVRGDSDFESLEEKRVDSEKEELSLQEAKRVRNDSVFKSFEFYGVDSSESGLNSSEANRIPDDILDILDEPDTVTDCDSAIENLDSVIKSFEEEILHPSPHHQAPALPSIISELTEPQPDLGYLLEASDDELGLPPTFSPTDEQSIAKVTSAHSATVALTDALGLEDELPDYDSFGVRIGEESHDNNGEFVSVGGLFDYDPADFSEFLFRPESLHAL